MSHKPKSIIEANPDFKLTVHKDVVDYLNVSEMFYDTIQGEGVYTGHPAIFIRLQNCVLSCTFCDSRAVWRYGNTYTMDHLFQLMEEFSIIDKLKINHHLVITGGSPLLQQDQVFVFISKFMSRYGFKPFIEVENECVIMPRYIQQVVDCWNNSPKLQTSGNNTTSRYKQDVLKYMSGLKNSWFKFVLRSDFEWQEIQRFYLDPGYIKKEQVILMPIGGSMKELERNRLEVVRIAIENGVRYCTREHLVLWGEVTGV